MKSTMKCWMCMVVLENVSQIGTATGVENDQSVIIVVRRPILNDSPAPRCGTEEIPLGSKGRGGSANLVFLTLRVLLETHQEGRGVDNLFKETTLRREDPCRQRDCPFKRTTRSLR